MPRFKMSRSLERPRRARVDEPDEEDKDWQQRHDDTLKRRRFHSANKAVTARYSSHWQEKKKGSPGDLLPSSVKPTLRYGREALRTPTQRSTPKPPDLVDRSCQADVRPKTRNALVHCHVPTRNMTSQTRPLPREPPPVTPPDMADIEIQTPSLPPSGARDQSLTQDDIDRLIQSIEPVVKTNATSAAAADSKYLVKRMKQSHENLAAKLQTVLSVTEDISQREDQLMTAIHDCSDKCEPCPGPHIAEETIHEIPEMLNGITKAIDDNMVTVEDLEHFNEEMNLRLVDISETVRLLKEQQQGIMVALEKSKMDYEPFKEQEKRLTNIAGMLEEVYNYTKKREAVHTEREGMSKVSDVDVCTCANDAKSAGDVNIELCQKCTNSSRGQRFLENNSLPLKDDVVANRIGKIIECIEKDADEDLRVNLDSFKKEASSWTPEEMQHCLGNFFQMALLWKSADSAMVLEDDVNTCLVGGLQPDGDSGENRRSKLGQYIKRAIDVKNTGVVRKLLKRMKTKSRMELINSSFGLGSGTTYLIFESARACDVETFALLINDGADLDLRERSGRTILHELVHLTSVDKLPHTEKERTVEETDAVFQMLDMIYRDAGRWWHRRQEVNGSPGTRAVSQASCTTALRYLFQLEDAAGRNALLYAAEVGSAEMVNKLLQNPPYHFISDPNDFGMDSGYAGKGAYIVDEIEGSFAAHSKSVIERIIRRHDGSNLMGLEPIHSMCQDKWSRFQIFFWMWFFVYLLYMSIFTACAVSRPLGATSIDQMYKDNGDFVRAVGEIFVALGLPLFFFGEVCDYRRNGWVWPKPWTRQGAFRFSNATFVVLVIVGYILRISLSPHEDICVSSALFIGWMMSTQFMVPSSYSGIFPVVMFEVFIGDFLVRFLWVFSLVLAAAGTATFCAYQGSTFDPSEENPHESFWGSIFSTFKLTFGMLDADYVTKARSPVIGVILFLLYIWLGPLLLLNLMIAMMVDTYALTRQQQDITWLLTVGRFAMLLDRRLPKAVRIHYNGTSHRVKELRAGRFGKYLYSRTKLIYLTRQKERRNLRGQQIQEEEHLVLVP